MSIERKKNLLRYKHAYADTQTHKNVRKENEK